MQRDRQRAVIFSLWGNSGQMSAQAAQADPAIEHIFVYLHHPFYSTTMAEVPPDNSTDAIEPTYRAAVEGVIAARS